MRQVTFFFFFMACFFMSNAIEQQQPQWKILSSSYDLDPSGAYNFGYETENAIQQNEEGSLKRIKNEEGKEEDVVVVRGSYSYQDPNGQLIRVDYWADETGFHAEGAHIPVPNGVPSIGVQTTPRSQQRPRF